MVYQNLFLFLPTFELITYQLNILFYAKIFYNALYFGNAFRHDDGSGNALAAVTADDYTPIVTENEISVFLETSYDNAKIWARNDKVKQFTTAAWLEMP